MRAIYIYYYNILIACAPAHSLTPGSLSALALSQLPPSSLASPPPSGKARIHSSLLPSTVTLWCNDHRHPPAGPRGMSSTQAPVAVAPSDELASTFGVLLIGFIFSVVLYGLTFFRMLAYRLIHLPLPLMMLRDQKPTSTTPASPRTIWGRSAQ